MSRDINLLTKQHISFRYTMLTLTKVLSLSVWLNCWKLIFAISHYRPLYSLTKSSDLAEHEFHILKQGFKFKKQTLFVLAESTLIWYCLITEIFSNRSKKTVEHKQWHLTYFVRKKRNTKWFHDKNETILGCAVKNTFFVTGAQILTTGQRT